MAVLAKAGETLSRVSDRAPEVARAIATPAVARHRSPRASRVRRPTSSVLGVPLHATAGVPRRARCGHQAMVVTAWPNRNPIRQKMVPNRLLQEAP
jgi:hypothetical protein